MSKSKKTGRRGFLRGAAGAALAAQAASTVQTAQAQQPAGANQVAASPAGRVEVNTPTKFGGDFMVDVIKSLGFEYVCANPGSSFRSLHESLLNYGGNKAPDCAGAGKAQP